MQGFFYGISSSALCSSGCVAHFSNITKTGNKVLPKTVIRKSRIFMFYQLL
ncbi:MAG: hypothetical protein RLZZ316_1488 [Bacteroidota bacterium]